MSVDDVTSVLSEVGDGVYAYVPSSGSWGWSNAGLVTDGDQSLLIDTLFTVPLTQEMLATMRRAAPAAATEIDVLVNSHADADHTWGNQLLANSRMIATEKAAEDIGGGLTPDGIRATLADKDNLGVAGRFFSNIFAPFDFSGIDLTRPSETFNGSYTVKVGDKEVELIDVGPAHSRGDLIVHLPSDRVAFVADLLFNGGHPAVWAGPLDKWMAACDRVVALDVDVVVPGHGPVTDTAGVVEFRDYLAYVQEQAIQFHARGASVDQAAQEIDLWPYSSWSDPERIIVAIDTVYREIENDTSPRDRMALFGRMGEMAELGHAGH